MKTKWLILGAGAAAVLYFVVAKKTKKALPKPIVGGNGISTEPSSIDFTAEAYRWDEVYDRELGGWVRRCVDSNGNIVAVRRCAALHTL